MIRVGTLNNREYIRWNMIKARADLNLKQSDLAKLVGVSQKSVSSWEKGIHTPRTNQAIKLVEILGKDINHLLSAKKEL